MKKSETSSPKVVGGNSSSGFTRKLELSPEVESKWRQLRDYETDSAWDRSCMISDPESYGKIKRYYMLRKALFGPDPEMDNTYKFFVDRQISGFTTSDYARMESICNRIKKSMPFTDVGIDDHIDHACDIFRSTSGWEPLEGPLADCLGGIIVDPNSRPQTIYGYRELPVIIVPSLKNVWDLLILVHELTHAIHIHISSDHNEIDRFVPDEMVTETIANSFQFAALQYIALAWGSKIANYMWDMLLLFGLDDNVHHSKKKATLFGIVLSPRWPRKDPQLLYNVMKSGDDYGIGYLGALAGYKSESEIIETSLELVETEISF